MLNLFALFHLNLAFSSIEEEQRCEVVAKCYAPLLDLAERHGPIGIEATAYTLKAIAACDPGWISRLKTLVAAGKVEFIGSGYAQMIGPLVPAGMLAANLRLGHTAYHDMLGVRPRLGLVNEQAYSGGLVGAYLDAGYEALLVDWDNVANHHPDWRAELRYAPQRALGSDGRDIAILWTNTVAFQKLQRLAHDDISLDDYLAFVAQQRGTENRVYCLYASDAEIFGFRPGRYRTEETNPGRYRVGPHLRRLCRAGEDRGHGADRAVRRAGCTGQTPAAGNGGLSRAGQEAAQIQSHPLGRHRARRYRHQRRLPADLRSTEKRQCAGFRLAGIVPLMGQRFSHPYHPGPLGQSICDLAAMEKRLGTAPLPSLPDSEGESVADRHIDIATPMVRARLDRRRDWPSRAPVLRRISHR